MTRRIKIVTCLAVFMLVVGSRQHVKAQICIDVNSDPKDATLTVRNGMTVSQTVPARFCGLRPGIHYILSLSSPGFEKREVKFSFEDYGQPLDLSGGNLGKVARSTLIPGWGQAKMGHRGRLLETMALLSADGLKVWQAWKDYDAVRTTHENITLLANSADTRERLLELENNKRVLA